MYLRKTKNPQLMVYFLNRLLSEVVWAFFLFSVSVSPVTASNDLSALKEVAGTGGTVFTNFFYRIRSKQNTVLDSWGGITGKGSASLQYDDDARHVNRQWELIDSGGGYYRIRSKQNTFLDRGGGTGKGSASLVLDPPSLECRESLARFRCEGGMFACMASDDTWDALENCEWKFIDSGGGYYKIKSVKGTVLDSWGGITGKGSASLVEDDGNVAAYVNRQWQFVPIIDSLHEAVSLRDLTTIFVLLRSGKKLTDTDSNNWTPLHVAAQVLEAKITNLVIHSLGTDHDPLLLKNNFDDTPLHVAAVNNNVTFLREAFKIMPQWIANNLAGYHGNTLLHSAVGAGHIDVVDFLLREFSAWLEEYDISKTTYSGYSSLDLALIKRDERMTKLLLHWHSVLIEGGKKGFDLRRALDIWPVAGPERKFSNIIDFGIHLNSVYRVQNEHPGEEVLHLSEGLDESKISHSSVSTMGINALTFTIKETERQIREQTRREESGVSRVLLLGVTGSGKTTLVHALAGKNLVVNARLLLDVPSGQELPGFTIGHTAASATVAPVSWSDRLVGLSYWDCPGFVDSRGSGQDIVNAFAVDQLFTAPSRIKSLLVVQESEITDSRGRDVFARFDKLAKLLPDPEELYRSIVLVVTKGRGEFSPHELLRGIDGIDSPLLHFFVEHPETVFSFPCPLKGSHGSIYSLFEDRDRILAKLQDRPVENPRHAIDLEPHSIVHLLEISKDFGDMREHMSNLASVIQSEYRRKNLAELYLWKDAVEKLTGLRDEDLKTPDNLIEQFFGYACMPQIAGFRNAMDQIASSYSFINFLTRIQQSGFLICGMEVPSIPVIFRPLLEKLHEELNVLIENACSMELEKQRTKELALELERKKQEGVTQEQNQKRMMEEAVVKAQKEQELLKTKLDEQVRAGEVLKEEARCQIERQEQEAKAEKARLDRQWQEMRVSMERSQQDTLSRIELQKRDALERADRSQWSLESVQSDLDRVRREHRDSQSAWESRLEAERERVKQQVIEQVRHELAGHMAVPQPFGMGGFPGAGGFYFG
jgi:hypothetical protein